MNRIKSIIFAFLLVSHSFKVLAIPKALPVPRFVSLKFNQVNARVGPAQDCPIEWEFLKTGEPVEVVAEHEQWRKIVDIYGEGGWVHARVLSGKRYVIIVAKKNIDLRYSPTENSQTIAYIMPEARGKLIKCQDDWCKVEFKDLSQEDQLYQGWIKRKYLWGVYPDEKI